MPLLATLDCCGGGMFSGIIQAKEHGMPTPSKGESRKDFLDRCIPYVMREGTAENGSQAAAICHSLYRKHKKAQASADKEEEEDKKHGCQ